MRDFQLTAALFLCLVSPGPGQAWGKSNLRSDIKHVFFLSANAVHTSNATAANQVSGPTAKLARKVREQKPKVCFSLSFPWLLALRLQHFLWAHLKVSDKVSALCSQAQGLLQFFYGGWIGAVGLFHVSIFNDFSSVLGQTCHFCPVGLSINMTWWKYILPRIVLLL